jgi:hypothetical protein
VVKVDRAPQRVGGDRRAVLLGLAILTESAGEPLFRDEVCVDQAGWHVAHDLVLPAGIDLVFLPAYSPELQPADRLWALVDEPVTNRAFPDLDALEDVLVERCRTFEADPTRLRAHTHYHWWPAEPLPESMQ